jgi:DNA-directed RNA polymerase specialized sigma24 family protein
MERSGDSWPWVFLKVFIKLETFDGNEIQFAAWVFKIARNT